MKKILLACVVASSMGISSFANAAWTGNSEATANIVFSGPTVTAHTITPAAMNTGYYAAGTNIASGAVTTSTGGAAWVKFTSGTLATSASQAITELSGTNNPANKLTIRIAGTATGAPVEDYVPLTTAGTYALVTTTSGTYAAETYQVKVDAAMKI